MSIPPDHGHLLTEQRNGDKALHRCSTADLVAHIQEADRQIHSAMAAAQVQLTAFIDAVEPGFLKGARLLYLGTGTSGRLGVLDVSEAPPTV